MGLGGYQLGHFPAGWSEWNDRYRDTVRAFWRRDGGKLGEFAERFAGSSDVFRHNGRKPTAGINLLTAHDGFTLYDLVSYNERHNEANLENNADGHSNNLSWNCGVEGPTDDAAIEQAAQATDAQFPGDAVPVAGRAHAASRRRIRRAPSAATTTPTARTTRFPGSTGDCALRITSCWSSCGCSRNCAGGTSEFRRETFLKGAASRTGVKDVTWLNVRGTEMTQE